MSVPDGGDHVATILVLLLLLLLLLVPLCLGDTREWHWRAPDTPLEPVWRGVSYAAVLVARLQTCIIYASVVVSKVTDYAWSHGTAMYYTFYDSLNGIPSDLRPVLSAILDSGWLNAALAWSVILTQLVMAITVVGPARARPFALVLGTGLHVAIIVIMGLPSFGLVMVALLVVATAAPSWRGVFRPRVSGRLSADRSSGKRFTMQLNGHL
jgi:antimicrobial peptide system SdpB family protein